MLSGQLVDEKDQPVHDATVVVFAADADKWFESSRAVKPHGQISRDSGGSERCRRATISPSRWSTSKTARGTIPRTSSLRKAASSVSLAEGASRTVVLKARDAEAVGPTTSTSAPNRRT